MKLFHSSCILIYMRKSASCLLCRVEKPAESFGPWKKICLECAKCPPARVCGGCGQLRDGHYFYKRRYQECKACTRNRQIASRHADPLKQSRKVASDAAYRSTPEGRRRVKDSNLRRYYGISVEQYEALIAAAEGVCEICKGVCPTGRALAVDHDHVTNRVRGVLCSNCNQALGKFKDDQWLLLQAVLYLQKERK